MKATVLTLTVVAAVWLVLPVVGDDGTPLQAESPISPGIETDANAPAPIPAAARPAGAGTPIAPALVDIVERAIGEVHGRVREFTLLFTPTDAVAREFSFRNMGPLLLEFGDAVSREFSFRNSSALDFEPTDAVARDFTFRNESPVALNPTDAIAPDFTFRNETPIAHESTDAIAREFSFQNETTVATTVTDAIAREFSYYMPVADLAVRDVNGPTSVFYGEPVELSWAVDNLGDHVATAPWIEAVYLSADGSLGDTDIEVYSVAIETDLPDGATSAPRAATIAINQAPGDYYLFIVVDAEGDVPEDDTRDDNVLAWPFAIEPTPAPDLVALSVTGPELAVAGDSIIVEYEVVNDGTLAVAAPWQDAIYLSRDTVLSFSIDTLLRLDPINLAPLPPGEGYTRSRTVQLPLGWPAGESFLFVLTDAGDVTGDGEYQNNDIMSGPIQIEAAPAPDLVADTVTTVDTALFGDVINVAWEASNIGTATADSVWSDVVFLSDDDQLSPDDRFLGLLSIDAAPLDPNTPPYARNLDVTLSIDGHSVAGDYYVLVSVDGNGALDELDEENNVAAYGPIAIDLPDLPDLMPANVQGPATVAVGELVTVTWDIDNNGPLPSGGSFICTVGARPAGGSAAVTPLANVLVETTIGPGSSEPATTDVLVPELGSAAVEFQVCVDTFEDIIEGDESNNCAVTAATPYERPDLRILPWTPPTTVEAEELVPLSIDIENAGAAAAIPNGYWLDSVYLSPDATVGNDILLASLARTSDVPAAGAYTISPSVAIPPTLSGEYYFVVRTDVDDRLIETDDQNNAWIAESPTTVTQPARPNLRVTSISTPPPSLSGQMHELMFEVSNSGGAAASGSWLDRVYASPDQTLSLNDDLLGELLFTGTLDPNAAYTQTLDIQLPSRPDTYYLIVKTDAADTVFEGAAGGENDNVTVDTTGFDVTSFEIVSMSATNPGPPKEVLLSGVAEVADANEPAANVPVVIRVAVSGFERTLTAWTDAAGVFDATFVAGPSEGGHYTVKAGPAHVASSNLPVLTTFDLYALVTQPTDLTLHAYPNVPLHGTFRLKNPTDLPQTSIDWTIANAPAELVDIVLLSGNNLAPNSSTEVAYTIMADANTPFTNPVEIQFGSAEGGTATMPIDLTVAPAQAVLQIVPADLDAEGYVGGNMPLGERTFVEVRVQNIGGGATAPLAVQLPQQWPWIQLATPNPLPALGPGEIGTVVLQLDPPADLALGTYYAPIPVVFGAPQPIELPVRLIAMSTGVGSLEIECTDEFTYYDEANGYPRVAGADIRLFNNITGDLVAQRLSDPNGMALFEDLNEAYYDIEVTAPDHGAFRSTVLVRGGRVTEVEAFLPRQLVTFNWSVVPTDIQDEYRITIDATFQTQVPAPVVVVEPSHVDLAELELPAQVNFTVTNYGLITAKNVEFSVISNDFVELVPLVTEIGDLPGGCTEADPFGPCRVTVPVLLLPPSRPVTDNAGCGPAGVRTCWELVCGDKTYTYCGGGSVSTPGCPAGGIVHPLRGGGGGCCAFVPSGGPTQSLPCDFCFDENDAAECLAALTGCVDIPCVGNGYSCANGPWGSDNLGAAANCARQGLACAADVAVGLACPQCGIVTCICTIIRDCTPTCQDTGCIPCSVGDLVALALTPDPCGGSGLSTGPFDDPIFDAAWYWYRATARHSVAQWYIFDDDLTWAQSTEPAALLIWMDAFIPATANDSEEGVVLSQSERDALLATTYPSDISAAQVVTFMDRWNRTQDYYSQGIYTIDDVPVGWSTDFIQKDVMDQLGDAVVADQAEAQAAGFDSVYDAMSYYQTAMEAEVLESGEGVCATVKIQIDQTATLTRSGFRATLELDNGGGDPLEAVLVDVRIRDELGNDATDLFGLHPPELTGALSAVDGTGSLPGGASGTASWLIVPTNEAAPLEPTVYFVSGTLQYGIGGNVATIPLYPVQIDVLPNPNLELKYFLETTVYSDDPFTPELEPAIPFSLGLLVANTGAGVARDMTITSAQPEIVENEKGLLIDFDIIGTQVGNNARAPSLTVNLGDIGPGMTAVARWLMTATLQGEFISYSASFEHVDSLGDPRLSLIESVDIFGLNHVVRVDESSNGVPPDAYYDFLTDDFPDLEDLPDRVHHSDNRVEPVTPITDAAVTTNPPARTAEVTLTMPAGFAYIRIDDPFNGQYRLGGVTRGDGKTILTDENAWQTSRVNRAQAGSPVERHIHIFDRGGDGTYTLSFLEDGAAPEVVSWSSVAVHGSLGEIGLPITPGIPASEPRLAGITKLVVTFNEPIDPATFTATNLLVDGFDAAGEDVVIPPLSTSMTLGDQAGVIEFASPLPAGARYCVTLVGVQDGAGNFAAGDGTRLDITALPGDTTGDRRVNNTDVGGVVSLVPTAEIDPLEVYEIRSDVNTDGVIDDADRNAVLDARGPDARLIPNPCLTK